MIAKLFRRSVVVGVCACMLALSGCTLWAVPKRVSWTNATGAEQFERLFWQSVQEKDWQAVESRMASTFVASMPEGVMNKEETMQHLRSMEISDVSIGEVQVTEAGNDAIVTYTLMLKGTAGGHRLAASAMRVMSVWQQQKKGYALQAWSGVPMR